MEVFLKWEYIYIDVDLFFTDSDDQSRKLEVRSRILVILGYWNVQSNLNLECLCLLEAEDCVF